MIWILCVSLKEYDCDVSVKESYHK